MPEGDTLHNIAKTLRPALLGKTVTRIELVRLAGDSSVLLGTKIIEVEAQGKNLLIHFSNGLVLHTHMKMPGIWHLYRPGETWKRSPAGARVMLEVADFQAVCFSAPVVRILKEENLRRDRQISNLGPDLLAPVFDEAKAIEGLRNVNDWPLGVAVMHQSAVAGIGNVYKSELLFLEQLNPFEPVSKVDDEKLKQLLNRARKLMKVNVGWNSDAPNWQRRTTRFGGESDDSRVWVYRRRDMPCFRCGIQVRMKRQGDSLRSTYFCPKCQGISVEQMNALFG